MVTPNLKPLTWNELIRPSNIGREIVVTYFDPDDILKNPTRITKHVALLGTALIDNQRVLIVHWDWDDEVYLITREGQDIFWNAYLDDKEILWYEGWKL